MILSDFIALTTLSTLSQIASAAVGTNFFFGAEEAKQIGLDKSLSPPATINTALRHRITYHQRIAGDGSNAGQGSLTYRMIYDILESNDTGDETKTTTRPGVTRDPARDDDDRLRYRESAYS